jgi:uncharacterized membrane protein
MMRRNGSQAVHQQGIVLKPMPFNNATQMIEDERALLKRWYEVGAPMN